MDSALVEVILPDGSIRVSDGTCERHLRLDAIERYGHLRVDVTRFVLRDGTGDLPEYRDEGGIPLAQPRYDHFYIVADAAELSGGTVRWMGVPVTKAVDGEVVVLTRLAMAQEIYGSADEGAGLYEAVAQLYRSIEAAHPEREPGTAEGLEEAAREMGVTPRLLQRSLDREAALGGEPDGGEWPGEEPEWDE